MTAVALCIVGEHDLWLVALALLVCFAGSAATMQLVGRLRSAHGRSRLGWIVMAATATGTMVWATHFIAMMAFREEAPVVIDPFLTMTSLTLAIGIAAPGLAWATSRRRRTATIGGVVVGAAISAMHYVGMAAYRVDGIVSWDMAYVAASVILSSLLAGLAFRVAHRAGRGPAAAGAALLGLAVVVLHFTGMTAMSVAVLDLQRTGGLSTLTQTVLAISTAFAGLLVLGCAATSALIDGSNQSESFRRLRRMALHDGLTDLPNRMSYHEELNRRLAADDGEPRLAAVMLDLSRFKAVNDTYGHQAGDQLLIALAARLEGVLEEGECVARLGGDEFGALKSYGDAADLDDFLARLAGVFDAPFQFERFTASIRANVGVALAPTDGRGADELLARADLAMYRAKSARSGAACFYDATMDDAVRGRRELAVDLRAAITAGAFELHYQVQAEVGSGEIAGYEALVRWRHPVRGLVSPSEFISLAEEVGEIIPLSVWVLRQACFEAVLWPGQHPVAVNLSPLHLSDPGLVDTVRRALDDSGLPAERLALELTESAIIRDRAYALDQLRALKAMGVGIALDDFGVGYSSLDVLRSFPFDKIKLDASFVAGIERDEQAVSILRSVASLGATLHMPVLAEGVERPAQLAIAAREGCSLVQGFIIGRPSRSLADAVAVRRTMRRLPSAVSSGVVAA